MDVMQKRLSVPMTAEDLRDLALLRAAPEAARAIGIDDVTVSDAALVRALFRLRLDAARDEAQRLAYAELAKDPEWQERSRIARARNRAGAE